MADDQELRVRDRASGAALAAARTAQNLSIADVARQLKLSAGQIAALEAGEFDRLPGPVFVRGFARNYARLLKLDPERIVDSITPPPSRQEARDAAPAFRDIPFPSQTVRRRPRFVLVALLVLTALAAYEFYWRDRTTVVTVTKPAAPSVPLVAPAEQTGITPVTAGELPASGAAAPEPAGTPQPAQEGSEAAAADSQPAASGEGAGGAELRFVFDKDSWVQVRERSGKTIFTRLNPAGSEQSVSGQPPFTLVIGNAGGVRLTYNERPVDLGPHIVKDDVARLTLE